MPDIHIIEPISWESGGPVAKGPGGRAQQVSLHQGELDRACGVYSLLMALLVWGVVDRDDLVGHAYDRRERLGRFMEKVRTLFSGLIVEGTRMDDLRDLVAETFHTRLDWEYWPYGGTSVRRFGYDLTRTTDAIRPGYRMDETCPGTVPEALTCFLEADDFEETVRLAVSLGGDADTLACIAGSVAEAHWSVPEPIASAAVQRLDAPLLAVVERFRKWFQPDGIKA